MFGNPDNIYRKAIGGLREGDIRVVPKRRIRHSGDILGHIDPQRGGETEIHIKQGLTQYLAGKTFYHEIVHEFYPNATEEEVCDFTENSYDKLSRDRRATLERIAMHGSDHLHVRRAS